MSNLQTYYHFKLDLKSGPTYGRQVVNLRHQTMFDIEFGNHNCKCTCHSDM